jgi:predicted phosphodiesterase
MTLITNTTKLKENKTGRAQIIPLGDIHLGYPTCNLVKLKEEIDYCVSRDIYVLGMGDYLECGLTTSVGDSVYHQKLNPQQQMDAFIELMQPLVKKGLLLGLHGGNHEARITKSTGLDITKTMCRILGVRYFGAAIQHLFIVGKERYTAYSTHGSSGARLPETKLRSVIQLARFANAEILLMGHLHQKGHMIFEQYAVDRRGKEVKQDKHAILTGHFLEYRGSYAEANNMPPSKTGVVKVSLYSDRHAIYVSE